MQKLQCELCGSLDIIKIETNVFECQSCGCRYTTEQAKSILSNGEIRTKAIDFEIIGGKLEKYNGEAKNIIIPDSVTVVGERSFYKCSGITKVIIPDSVTLIENEAFDGCSNLIDVQFSNQLSRIGIRAFYGCSSLKNVSLPNSIESIADNAFSYCTSLTSISVPDSAISIGNAFNCCENLRIFSIPANVKAMSLSFWRCKSLEKLIIPKSVSISALTIQRKDIYLAFENCVSLIEIECSDDIKQYFYSLLNLQREHRRNDMPPAFAPFFERIDNEITAEKHRWAEIMENNEERHQLEKREAEIRYFRNIGVCEYCGGYFQGVFIKRCSKCGKKKSY